TEVATSEKRCLFGYVSDNPEEFIHVIKFLDSSGIEVLSTCKEEGLIFVTLNQRFKDYPDLFMKIEQNFEGTCFYKSDIDEIRFYDNCRDRYTKEQIQKSKQ
ncbi:MAG: hypothetical protein ABIJ16_06710, partial [Bacteroidota bacterium]